MSLPNKHLFGHRTVTTFFLYTYKWTFVSLFWLQNNDTNDTMTRIFDFRVIIVLFLVYYLIHYISLFFLTPINLPDILPRMLFENIKIK